MSQSTGLRRVAAAVRPSVPGNLPIRRAATAQGTLGPLTVFGAGTEAGGLLSAWTGKPSPIACWALLIREGSLASGFVSIRHHRLRHSTTLLFSSGPMAGLRGSAIRQEPEEPAQTGPKLHLIR